MLARHTSAPTRLPIGTDILGQVAANLVNVRLPGSNPVAKFTTGAQGDVVTSREQPRGVDASCWEIQAAQLQTELRW